MDILQARIILKKRKACDEECRRAKCLYDNTKRCSICPYYTRLDDYIDALEVIVQYEERKRNGRPLQKIQLNNPITLHFYSTEEKMPDDYSDKIVILNTEYMGSLFFISRFNISRKVWEYGYKEMEKYFSDHVVAWASFSPEWVLGVYL